MSQPFPSLIPGETALLQSINACHSPMLDALMYMVSNPGAWTPLIVVLLYVLFYKRPWQEGLLVVLSIGLSILVCDSLSSGFAKPYFARPRPTHFEGIGSSLHIVYNYMGGPYGFFSGHASNFVAAGIILCRVFADRWHSLLVGLIVTLVIYSRLYLGVHFISDILAGSIIGAGVGVGVSLLHQQVLRKRFSPLSTTSTSVIYASRLMLWRTALVLFLLTLVSYSWQVSQIVQSIS